MIPKEKQKLIFNDQVLKPDNSPVYWIAGVGVGCKIHLGMRLTIFYIEAVFLGLTKVVFKVDDP